LSLSTPRIFILTDFQPDFRQASLEGAHWWNVYEEINEKYIFLSYKLHL
jgi:hypothetical protein